MFHREFQPEPCRRIKANNDPEPLRAFIDFLDGKDPKTIAAYRATLRAFVAWLATMPGGDPFRVELVTTAAVRGYLESLKAAGRAPRTQAKAITALQRFCRWAQDEGLLRRNPVAQIERPTVATLAPTELTPEARYVLTTLVERQDSKRLTAIVALAYSAALRISTKIFVTGHPLQFASAGASQP